jgi:hypothetical protein
MIKLADFRRKYPEYDDLSDDALLGKLYRAHYSDMPYREFRSRIQTEFDVFNPTEGMTVTDKFLAGWGKGLTDLALGAKQTVGLADAEDAAEKEALDEALMESTAANVGDVFGKISATLPLAFIPGANTYAGAAAIGGGLGMLDPVTGDNMLEQRALNTGMGAAGGMAGQWLGNRAGGLLGRWAASRQAAKEADQAANAVRDASTEAGQRLGYTVEPVNTNPSAANNLLQGYAGKLSTRQLASERNMQITDDIARRALGLPDDTPITPEMLTAVRQNAGEAYETVSNKLFTTFADNQYLDDLARLEAPLRELGEDFSAMDNQRVARLIDSFTKDSFTTKNAIMAIRQLREDAKALFISTSPGDKAEAQVRRGLANALEDIIERNLAKSGDDGLMSLFRAARERIAKSYSIEKALNPGTGHVNANKLAAQLKAGKPISGELRDAAAFAATHPHATKEVLSASPGISPLDAYAAGGLSLTHQDPSFLALALGRPAARNLILSRPYQRMMTPPSYRPGLLSRTAPRVLNSGVTHAGMAALPYSVYAQQE